MKKINRKTYYITMLLWIINNNILTCMEYPNSQNSNSQNTINTNIPALSLCSTNNNNITIEEKNVDQQETELSEEYNDILIETLRDNLNNILKEGQYDFQSIMETFQNLGEKIFIPFVKKLLEKENFDKKSSSNKNGEEKYIVAKGEDWLGYEKKENIFFYGHYKKEFDKVGVEINYKENSVFYGFWVNREKLLSKKFLGVEFNKEGCFIGVYDYTKEKKTNGLYIKPDQIEIITQTFEPCIISKKNFNINNLKKIHVQSKKEYIKDKKKYIENIKNVGFYLAKLKEMRYDDSECYAVKNFLFLNDSEIKENEIIESHIEKASSIGWIYKYPGIEKKEIITRGETFLYNNDEIGVALCIVFDKEGIYNVRIEKKIFNDKKEKKKKGIYFIRDNIFQLEQETQNSSKLRRYNIYLVPREQDSTWVDILNKKNQEKKFDLFFESYSVSKFERIDTEKRLSKNICIFKNGTFMYKEPYTHLDPIARTEIYQCTLVNDFNKTYENGSIFCRINEENQNCYFLKENYERQEGENCFKTDEDGKMKFLSNRGISVNIKKFENFTVYSYTKNNYEYNIYVKNNEIVKIIIFEDENVTILYPQEKNFSKINNKIEDNSESQNIIKNEIKYNSKINYSDDESDKENDNEKNEINCISKRNYSDDESDNEETDDKKQKKLYEEICKEYGLQNLCEIINKTQDLQSRIKGNGIKYLLPGKEIIDKTEKEIIDKNVIKQKISKQKEKNFNKIDIKEEIKSKEENILKIYTLIKEENELNKKGKNIEDNWDIKKKKKKKKKNNITIKNVNNKVDNPNDNLHKNNDDYFFSESDYLEFKNDIFLGKKTTKNYVVQDRKDTKHDKFLNTLKEKKIYNQYCDLLNILIFDPFSFFKKKLQGNIFEAKLNERYRLYLKKIDKNLYRIDNNGKNKQEVAKSFFLLYDNIEHIKYKKNQ